MNKLFKNKAVLAGAVVVILLLLIAGGAYFFLSKTQNQTTQADNPYPTQVPVLTMSASSLGLSLKLGPSGKTVIVTVSKTDQVKEIDYELSYTAQNPSSSAGSNDTVPRGVLGQLDLTKSPASKEIILGTCSDVCHYDQGIQDIKIILKVTKNDGKIYQAQSSLPIPTP